MKLTLPIPPSLNNAYLNVRGKGRVKTKKAVSWYKEAYYTLHGVTRGKKRTLKTPYRIEYTFYFPDKRRRDIFNFEKLASDLLVDMKIIEDDSFIDIGIVRRGEIDKENPRMEILIETIGE